MVWDRTLSWRNTSCQQSLPSSVPIPSSYPKTTPYVCAFLIHIWTRDAASPLGQRETMGEHGSGQTTGLSMDPLLLSDNSVHEVKKVTCSQSQAAVCAQLHLPGGSQGTTCQSWGKMFPLDLRSHRNLAMSYPHITAPSSPGSTGAAAPAAEAAHYCLTAGREISKLLWADVQSLVWSAASHRSVPSPVPPAKLTESGVKSHTVNKKQAQGEGRIMLKNGTGLRHIKILVCDLELETLAAKTKNSFFLHVAVLWMKREGWIIAANAPAARSCTNTF